LRRGSARLSRYRQPRPINFPPPDIDDSIARSARRIVTHPRANNRSSRFRVSRHRSLGIDWWDRLVGSIGGIDWWDRLVGSMGGGIDGGDRLVGDASVRPESRGAALRSDRGRLMGRF
jgi:hypothetical protein